MFPDICEQVTYLCIASLYIMYASLLQDVTEKLVQCSSLKLNDE